MIAQMPEQLADALRLAEQFQSAMEHQLRQDNTSYRGGDEARTVEVTLNRDQRVTDVYIEDGLLRLGGDVVEQRLNEALRNARAAATAAREAETARLAGTLTDLNRLLSERLT